MRSPSAGNLDLTLQLLNGAIGLLEPLFELIHPLPQGVAIVTVGHALDSSAFQRLPNFAKSCCELSGCAAMTTKL